MTNEICSVLILMLYVGTLHDGKNALTYFAKHAILYGTIWWLMIWSATHQDGTLGVGLACFVFIASVITVICCAIEAKDCLTNKEKK